ncbi:hypothetical protein GCM10007103_25600 [Salinimicrobium marinum]|uniref:MobA/VirD2-like nuclease domain-containing protein n=1 Tax=Salinimicrobium marinum TaxID=680283 RepID=A0A918SHN7_9FLAO|nr:relaxase/mobilization nuclease domain-containing protein [Salinimicrobium marinum]GHA43208.1 hypothetical protein GCM10007103_25600 [Salinimicrobium marinum]
MTRKELGELARQFLKEMKLTNHQAIGFVHRDKQHTHIHIYVNRISLTGEVYKDNFIGKRSQVAADNVAKELELTRVREVQQEKLQEIMLQSRPRSLDEYISKMKDKQVKVIPSINKSNQLQGFRFIYKVTNLKGSEVHRSMSGNNIVQQISQNSSFTRMKESLQTVQLLSSTFQLSTGIIKKMAKDLVKGTIRRALGTGIEF